MKNKKVYLGHFMQEIYYILEYKIKFTFKTV